MDTGELKMKWERRRQRVEIIGMVIGFVIAVSIIASIWILTLTAQRLSRAESCTLIGIIAINPDDRNEEFMQRIVDQCYMETPQDAPELLGSTTP